MRAFVLFRYMLNLPNTEDRLSRIENEIQDVKEMDKTLAGQNDINELTHAHIDAISVALAELQANKPPMKPHRRIGFVQDYQSGCRYWFDEDLGTMRSGIVNFPKRKGLYIMNGKKVYMK